MLRKILAIAGRPGLFRLVSQGKNMLIVEEIASGRRTPAYARDKVSALGDISIYTLDGDAPLPKVLDAVYAANQGNKVDIKALDDKGALAEELKRALPDFDPDRVHPSDMRKLLQWYNLLLDAGFTKFADDETPQENAEEA